MSTPTNPQRASLSDYLAAERTFLAWIRTGLALMGFGFVVARFGVYLQQLRIAQHVPGPPAHGLSAWFGTALVLAGVTVTLFSAWQHTRLIGQLDRGEPEAVHSSARVLALAIFLALFGIAMAIYLIAVRGSGKAMVESSEYKEEQSMALIDDNGIANIASNHPVNETVEKVKGVLRSKGVTLFLLVDHSGEAEKVGMKMRPTKLLVFGSPKAGTPVMLAAPSSAIDLPLKILVWEDGQGKVWLSYNRPDYLQKRHGFPPELLANLSAVEAVAAKAAE